MEFRFSKICGVIPGALEVGVEYVRETEGVKEFLLLEVAPFFWGRKTLMKVKSALRYKEGSEADVQEVNYETLPQGLKVSAGQVAKKHLKAGNFELPAPPAPKRASKAKPAAIPEAPEAPAADDRQLSLF
jgi:hypothetical protein